ncbi:protein transport protein sec31-like isoform X2 [Pomacea canaliculata]|uniref:protein transport protein sec31-like isoform X2 n=1 Tax=Pomacea canaliculata TaxID=400727 RepID=UPI000D72C227|nr:protein transport protein sec31-like isoform X2 [Pomacea canaliculata]
MAVLSTKKMQVFLGVILVILLIVPNAQSRRSGSSRSSRAGRVFSVRRTGTNRLPVYTSGHVRKGTSPFTSNTFHMALAAGTIYGSVRYMRSPRFRQRDYVPPICRNDFYKPPNSSRVYGYFICPLDDQPENYTWCCGPSNQEFCCHANYYGRQPGGTSSGTSPFIIVGLIVAVIVVIAIAVTCYKKRKAGRKLLKSFSKKSSSHEPPPAYPEQGAPMPYGETKSGYPPSDVQYPMQPGTCPPAGPYPPPGPYPAPTDPYPAPTGPYPAPTGPYPAPTGPYPAPAGPYPAPAGPYPPSAEPYPQETPGTAPYPLAPDSYPPQTPSCPSDEADAASVPYGTAPYPAGPAGTPQPPSSGQFGGYGTQHGYSS